MAGIETQYTRTVAVKRLVSGEYTTHIASVACHIQPYEEGLSEDLTGNFGKDFLMFSAVVDIKEGDRVIEGSVQYHVLSTDSYAFLGIQRHMEIRIRVSNQ